MRPIAVLVSVVTLIAALAGIAWLGGAPATKEPVKASPQAASDKPQPRQQGPHPKAVIPETTFNFGVMQHRSKGSHKFVVKNEGTVPLKLQTGQTTCQCTIGKIGDETVPAGGETTIELNWEIKARNPSFQHQATIHTDDPEMLQFDLVVKGYVGLDIVHTPEELTFSAMSDLRPSKGKVFVASSSSADFKITKIDASSDHIKTEVTTVPENGRVDFYQQVLLKHPDFSKDNVPVSELVKQVYMIDVAATGQKKQGSFNETITIHTDIPETQPIVVTIRGENPGAFQFFPQGGARWYPKELMCDLGDINGSEGRKRALNVIGRGVTEALQLTVIKVEPAVLKVATIPDPTNKMACKIEFEIPPGTPAFLRTPDAPATVVLKSNHERTETIELKVVFNVQ